MNHKKIITTIGLASAILTAVPAATSIAFPTVEAYAQQNISTNPIADNTSDRSITIHKYQVADESEFGDRGDGKHKDVNKTALPGIKFKVQKVEAIGGKSLVDAENAVEGTDYRILNGDGITQTTGTDGSTKFDLGQGLTADGIYLVTELPDDRGVEPAVAHPADPFFVYIPQTERDERGGLIYDVEVQPKNVLESLLKPDKTIEGGRGYSIKAGQPFTWEATTAVPKGLYYVAHQDMIVTLYNPDGTVQDAHHQIKKDDEVFAQYFTMTDTLNKDLLLDDVKMQVRKDNGDWVDLVFGTDFNVSVNGTNQATAPVTEQTPGQEKKVITNLTNDGMKKVAQGDYTQIRTVYTTHTKNDFNGVIENSFNVGFLTPDMKPVDKPNPHNPKEYNGGFDIYKEGEDTKKALAGAEFRIALSEEDAKNGIFLASDGKTYVKDATLPDGVTFLTSTSNDSGVAKFDGLKLEWFTDSNNNGKQDLDIESEATFPEDKIQKSYWVVETKAPEGYELLKEPKEVVVNLKTATNENPELTVTDKPKTNLPFTGGDGNTLLIVLAMGALTIGTTAIVIDKKRRKV